MKAVYFKGIFYGSLLGFLYFFAYFIYSSLEISFYDLLSQEKIPKSCEKLIAELSEELGEEGIFWLLILTISGIGVLWFSLEVAIYFDIKKEHKEATKGRSQTQESCRVKIREKQYN